MQKKEISIEIQEGFEGGDYILGMINFESTYKKIQEILPQNIISFEEFGIEKMIACEVICSTICHKINWDYLRKVIYRKTKLEPDWLKVDRLVNLKPKDVANLLKEYNRKERIREAERCKMIRIVAKQLQNQNMFFKDIFLKDNQLKDKHCIMSFFNECEVFTKDPEKKKVRLIFQMMSDYEGFQKLEAYYEPAIDYHLIRLFIRRGIVRPINKYAYDYIFKKSIIRKESTIATLRDLCSQSLVEICWITSLNIKTVNQIEWWIGRSVCTRGVPDCELQGEKALWLKKNFSSCPFYDTCYARNYDKRFLGIDEPKYMGNSY